MALGGITKRDVIVKITLLCFFVFWDILDIRHYYYYYYLAPASSLTERLKGRQVERWVTFSLFL